MICSLQVVTLDKAPVPQTRRLPVPFQRLQERQRYLPSLSATNPPGAGLQPMAVLNVPHKIRSWKPRDQVNGHVVLQCTLTMHLCQVASLEKKHDVIDYTTNSLPSLSEPINEHGKASHKVLRWSRRCHKSFQCEYIRQRTPARGLIFYKIPPAYADIYY